MGDKTLNERVMDLEAIVKRFNELITELKEEKKTVFRDGTMNNDHSENITMDFPTPPKRRGNPNWIKRTPMEDQ